MLPQFPFQLNSDGISRLRSVLRAPARSSIATPTRSHGRQSMGTGQNPSKHECGGSVSGAAPVWLPSTGNDRRDAPVFTAVNNQPSDHTVSDAAASSVTVAVNATS